MYTLLHTLDIYLKYCYSLNVTVGVILHDWFMNVRLIERQVDTVNWRTPHADSVNYSVYLLALMLWICLWAKLFFTTCSSFYKQHYLCGPQTAIEKVPEHIQKPMWDEVPVKEQASQWVETKDYQGVQCLILFLPAFIVKGGLHTLLHPHQPLIVAFGHFSLIVNSENVMHKSVFHNCPYVSILFFCEVFDLLNHWRKNVSNLVYFNLHLLNRHPLLNKLYRTRFSWPICPVLYACYLFMYCRLCHSPLVLSRIYAYTFF